MVKLAHVLRVSLNVDRWSLKIIIIVVIQWRSAASGIDKKVFSTPCNVCYDCKFAKNQVPTDIIVDRNRAAYR